MRINAELIVKLRKGKAWSQDELAIASGLNVRTIQRVETEASASLQSEKALASALDISIQDLDFEENIMKPAQFVNLMTFTNIKSTFSIPALEKNCFLSLVKNYLALPKSAHLYAGSAVI